MEKIKSNYVEQLYDLLKDTIQDEYSGGEKINFKKISDKYNISQTPIREALNRLVSDGIVTNLHHKGYYINNISMKDIEEVWEVRKMIECFLLKCNFNIAGNPHNIAGNPHL